MNDKWKKDLTQKIYQALCNGIKQQISFLEMAKFLDTMSTEIKNCAKYGVPKEDKNEKSRAL